jgi:hypothetical protein
MDRPNSTLLACQVKRKAAKIGVNRDLSSSFAPRSIRYGFSVSSLIESASENPGTARHSMRKAHFPSSIPITRASEAVPGGELLGAAEVFAGIKGSEFTTCFPVEFLDG